MVNPGQRRITAMIKCLIVKIKLLYCNKLNDDRNFRHHKDQGWNKPEEIRPASVVFPTSYQTPLHCKGILRPNIPRHRHNAHDRSGISVHFYIDEKGL